MGSTISNSSRLWETTTASRLPGQHDVLASNWITPLLWATLAASSIVFIEPAPYDLLMIGMACGLFCLGLRVPRAVGPGAFLLALFLIGNLGGALAGGYTGAGLRSLSVRIYMVLAWLTFATMITHAPTRTTRTIWSGYIVAAVVAVVWGVAQYYGFLPGEFAGPENRATGPFKDANVFAPFLVPIALLMVVRLFGARGPTLAFWIGLFLLMALGILLAFSRGAWINFASSFVVLTLLLVSQAPSRRQQLNFVLILVLLGLVGTASMVWVVDNTAAGAMFAERTALVQTYDVAAGGRFSTQLEALRTIGQTPFGIGPGMSTPVLGMEPHNLYLHTVIEGGWLGGLSFCLFLLLTIWRGLSRLRTASGELRINTIVVLASVLGVLLQSLFIDSTHWRHMWLLLAMLWGLSASNERQPGPIPPS